MKHTESNLSTRGLVFTAALAVGAGCGGGPQYMLRVNPPGALAVPPGQALLVFIRPSSNGGGAFTVADDQGHFVGQLAGNSYFVRPVPPGHYRFVCWNENSRLVDATVDAGRTYFVLANVRMGVWRARVGFEALTPHSDDWHNRAEWLGDARQYAPDLARGQADFAQDPSNVQEHIRDAIQDWSTSDAHDHANSTITPADGI